MMKGAKTMRKKLRSRRGESIAETLVSLLILTQAGLMLAGSIVSSARTNDEIEEKGHAFATQKPSDATANYSASVKITLDGVAATTSTVSGLKIYEEGSGRGLYYYE